MVEIAGRLKIPPGELSLSFARSSGPGGQNVNKVNSKAVLRWNIKTSPTLGDELRQLLLEKLHSRINVDGELVIASDRYRDQLRNREDCLEKLRALVASALARPKPRKKTKPSRSSQIKAKKIKRRHSEKKNLRGKVRI